MNSSPSVLVRCAVVALLMPSAASGAAPWDVIALSGRPAPGVPGVTLDGFQAYIAANGDVIFRGELFGQGVNDSNDLGIWLARGDQVELIAREGAQPAGYAAAYRYLTLYDGIAISDAGEAFFNSRIVRNSPFESEFVTSRGMPGAITPLARQGSTIVGASPQIAADRTLSTPLLEGGNVAFLDSNGPSDERIWSGPPSALHAVAIDGGQAPGLTAGVTYANLEPEQIFSKITANANGTVAFNAQIAGPGVLLNQNDRAMFVVNQSGGSLVARTGDQAPGVQPGAMLQRFENPVINSVDQVAFRAQISATADFPGAEGIWAGNVGSLQLAARQGAQAPGAPIGRTFNALYDPILGDDGTVAFYATLDDVGDYDEYGLWIGQPGQLQRVLATGMTAPGAPAGYVLRDFLYNPIYQSNGPLMNARGDVVFQGRVAPDQSTLGLQGVWALVGGTIQSVLIEGDWLDVDPDPLVTTLKQVSSMRIEGGTAGADGRQSSLNDDRGIVLEVLFADGAQAILRTTLVPEPAAISLVLTALALRACARRGLPPRQRLENGRATH